MILLVVGARPNFMKVSPIVSELKRTHLTYKIVHTGQHYDNEMSSLFFDDLKLPKPDVYLGVGSGTHAEQTANIMVQFERICLEEKPELIVVVGDVNSTIACALVAAKLLIPVAHIEAGLRSGDRTMPEEINRILTDHIADFLFTTCEDANQNLIREGIPQRKIFFVGNVMIDTLLSSLRIAKDSDVLDRLGLRKNKKIESFALLTLHRPSNVDAPTILRGILEALNDISDKIPVLFPAHPRTLKQIKKFRLDSMVDYASKIDPLNLKKENRSVFLFPPLGYLDFLCLMANSKLVFTDSGGIQEETTILGVPCFTLRNNTERPITEREGTNLVIGNEPDKIIRAAKEILEKGLPPKKKPKLWDGKAAFRIVNILNDKL